MFIEFIGDELVAKLTLDDGQRWILHQMHGDRYEGHPHRRRIEGTIAIPTLNGRIRAIKNFSKAAIVNEDDEHVGRAFGRPQRLDGQVLRIRVFGIVGRQPDMGNVGDGENLALDFVSGRHVLTPV
jgi:hypothetical protein